MPAAAGVPAARASLWLLCTRSPCCKVQCAACLLLPSCCLPPCLPPASAPRFVLRLLAQPPHRTAVDSFCPAGLQVPHHWRTASKPWRRLGCMAPCWCSSGTERWRLSGGRVAAVDGNAGCTGRAALAAPTAVCKPWPAAAALAHSAVSTAPLPACRCKAMCPLRSSSADEVCVMPQHTPHADRSARACTAGVATAANTAGQAKDWSCWPDEQWRLEHRWCPREERTGHTTSSFSFFRPVLAVSRGCITVLILIDC